MTLNLTKICSRCNAEKPTTEFGKDAALRDGLRHYCKSCLKAQNAAYYAENQEKINAKTQSPAGRFWSYKASAKQRNIAFKLSMDEFVAFWQKDCSYCGDHVPTIGLDRVDNNIGYEVDNVVSCCATCNTMKMDSSLVGWQTHMIKALQHMGITP